MSIGDLALFAIGLSAFLFLLVVLGIMADSWDARERRRDARERNRQPHARRGGR